VGVPQLLVRYVVLGGIRLTKVVGAVATPIAVAGLETAVPPEMSLVAPTTPVPSSLQTVVRVSTVGVVLLFTLACTRINSGS
jgi:hypothetical protein